MLTIAHVIPQEKFDVSCLHNNAVNELMRCIRLQRSNLITGLPEGEINAMSLGLAHRWVNFSAILLDIAWLFIVCHDTSSSLALIRWTPW